MIVTATEVKNNFGTYLKLLDQEDIIVTKNGSPVAKITRHNDLSVNRTGVVTSGEETIRRGAEVAREQATSYEHGGRRMSYEDFLKIYENTDERLEYIDGHLYVLDSPTVTHQRVIGNLHVMLRLWFQGKECKPYLSPFDVTLKKGENGINVVQPDLLVICDPESTNERDKYTGVPTLAIEVLSDSTARVDLIKKLDLYMQTGVQEYWIVNPINREVSVYRFQDGDIADMRSFVKDDTLRSFIFEGLTMELREVFA